MKKVNKFDFLGVKNPIELIGKIIKVSWMEDEENLCYSHFFTVNAFTVDYYDHIHFQPMVIDQGGELIQLSFFGKNEFHIVLLDNYKKTEFGTRIEKGYFYSTKKHNSHYISKGKIEIVN